LQYATVRPSTWFYPRFSLPMVRSPGFGSIYCYLCRPIQARFHYASGKCLKLATANNSLDRSTKSTPSPPKGLRLLVRAQFQVLFHSHSWVLFTFPSRYLFSIDRKIYLALGGGPPSFSQGFTCPDLLDKTNIRLAKLCVPGYHCLWPIFPNGSARNANL
jgi:hypothetical protein